MTRRSIRLCATSAAVLVGTLVGIRVITWHPLPVLSTVVPDRFTRVSGVTHVHTIHSDGGGTVTDIAAAADAAGLDFVVITDHNNLAAKPEEGYNDSDILTIIGTEISNREGHLLAVGLSTPTYFFSGDGLDTLQDLNDLGGLGFAAHPSSPRQDLRWTGWNLPGDWGVEILNGDSQWRAAGWISVLGAALLYPLNNDYGLLSLMRKPAVLSQWDKLLTRRHATAIASSDAHGTLRWPPIPSLPLPSYEAQFRIAQNYVLLEQPLTGRAPRDIQTILEALRHGRVYVGVSALANTDRFFFIAERNGRRWTMGDTLPPAGPVQLKSGGALPSGAGTTLYRNGEVIIRTDGPLDAMVTDPGVYRVEVEVHGWNFPLVISNPIYVMTESERERRARASSLPEPITAVPTTMLDELDSGTTFVAVADETTALDFGFTEVGVNAVERSSAQIAFTLGTPTSKNPSPYASLISYEPRDLSNHSGLVFSVKSDDTYRFWVQVRDRNPEAEEGTESWFASAKTDNAWSTVTVPFNQLQSANQHTDGSLDLSDIKAIVFLIDTGAVPSNTPGVIWFDYLGAF